MGDPLLDSTSLLLRQGLNGLARRQELIANNIANMDTAGYRAQDTPFEKALTRQINQRGDLPMLTTSTLHLASESVPISSAPVEVTRQGSMRNDGNGVDVDYEMARLGETTIQYNTVTQLLTAKMALLKSAVTDGRR